MHARFCRAEESAKWEMRFTPFCLKKAGESREWAPEYICRGAGQGIVQIRGREVNAKSYTVNLPARTCTCTHFQENSIPCSHAYAFILSLRERPDGYFPTILSTETWRSSYTENLQPVDITKIDKAAETDLCRPPPTKLHLGKGGRKKKARMEAGQHGQDNGQERSCCSQYPEEGQNVNKRSCVRRTYMAL